MPRASLLPLVAAATLCVACSQAGGEKDPLSEQQRNYLHNAEAMKQQGNVGGAIAIYKDLAQQEGDSIAAHMQLAALYRKIGKPRDAAVVLQSALAKHPGDTQALTQLGYALVESDQPREAVNVFDQLIAMRPHDASFHNAKAVAFDMSGNQAAAQEIYQKALTLAPDSVSIKNNLAMSMILNRQVDDAIALLEPLSQTSQANATVRQNLALAYGLKGDRERAMELGQRDVTPQQAEENWKFYRHYAKLREDDLKTDMSAHLHTLLDEPADAFADDETPAADASLLAADAEKPGKKPASPAAKNPPAMAKASPKPDVKSQPVELSPSAGGNPPADPPATKQEPPPGAGD